MNFKKAIVFALALAGSVFAADKTLVFYPLKDSVCVNDRQFAATCFTETGEKVSPWDLLNTVRIKILGAPEVDAYKYGIYIERPFFIVDGIHLSLTELRTLDQLQEETEAFGIPGILQAMGYTPILVQFSETVLNSLEYNADLFQKMLKFISSNKVVPFPNGPEEGFVVLGISQGGIIGRYGSYLYDIGRKPGDAPIRAFSSLDSPHQGAVMPRSLLNTIDFWAQWGDSPEAEGFRDLVRSPGARDLIIYKTDDDSHMPDLSSDRFLFGEYRKAAQYKGFPAILVSQGQLKGADPAHADIYYNLNRVASMGSATLGRATSKIGSSRSESTEYSHQSVYKMGDMDKIWSDKGTSLFDFVQGSTYPFPKTMYESLRSGFMDAMPVHMNKKIGVGIFSTHISVLSFWDRDNLYQESSTFIPTVSAMDLNCDGNLAIRSGCAHTIKAGDINFENPGNASTGKAVFGVDPTHPRYNEPISGRHIEPPVKDGTIDDVVVSGMQTDTWRLLCEIAKIDYDNSSGKFRNPKLNGYFSPNTDCMDLSRMPDIIRNAGKVQTRQIAYARYDYDSLATERTDVVKFKLPAGWQKVATFNVPEDIPAGSAFEIDVVVQDPKSNWMKAELLLLRDSRGNGQIQLAETDVVQNGTMQTLRWVMPNTQNATLNYKWMRLVLNSNGATVMLSAPRIVTSTMSFAELPEHISTAVVFPNSDFRIVPWSENVSVQEKTVGTTKMLYSSTPDKYDGFHIDFGKQLSLNGFNSLVVEFEPGTCTHTEVYFDAKDTGSPNLGNSCLQNGYEKKILPLSQIINTKVTPGGSYSVSRLKIQAVRANETCNIKSIYLD